MTCNVDERASFVRDVAGATLASYAMVTGAIAVVCIGAVTYLNFSTEKRVQERADKAGAVAQNQGNASLGSEVGKSTAIMGGVEMPFQFGLPLFSLPPFKKKKEQSQETAKKGEEASCPGGKCGGGESSCFVAGTLVLTPSGYRKIEDIRVGDEVLSVAEDSPWASPADVEETEDAPADALTPGDAAAADGTGGEPAAAREDSALGDP